MRSKNDAHILLVTGAITIGLVIVAKGPGLILGIILLVLAGVYIGFNSQNPEIEGLCSSVRLAGEDLQDLLDEYEDFAFSDDPTHVADRTLLRPELLNQDSKVEPIAAFHFQRAGTQRFLRRLEGHLTRESLSVYELENLLALTDARAVRLREAWWSARQAAQEIGPGDPGGSQA